jgi:hypothetical protein
VSAYEKGKSDYFEKSNKSFNKGKKGEKHPGTNSTARVPKKFHFEKHCNLCKKHGGAYTPRTILLIVVGLRRMERRNPVYAPPRKADIRVIP